MELDREPSAKWIGPRSENWKKTAFHSWNRWCRFGNYIGGIDRCKRERPNGNTQDAIDEQLWLLVYNLPYIEENFGTHILSNDEQIRLEQLRSLIAQANVLIQRIRIAGRVYGVRELENRNGGYINTTAGKISVPPDAPLWRLFNELKAVATKANECIYGQQCTLFDEG